jgi:hypothetical protein
LHVQPERFLCAWTHDPSAHSWQFEPHRDAMYLPDPTRHPLRMLGNDVLDGGSRATAPVAQFSLRA